MNRESPSRSRGVAKILGMIFMYCLIGNLPLYAQAAQTIRIESLDLSTTRRTLDQLRAQLQNVTLEPQTGIIWYVLASPGEKEPWRVYAYSSPDTSVQLAPGETRTIQLSGPNLTLDSQFELSVWLHGVNRSTGERFFSDYWVHRDPLLVAPRFSFSVDAIGNAGGNESSLLVRFSVRYNDDESANVGIRYQLGQKGETPYPDGPFALAARIASGVDYVMTVRHPGKLPAQPDGRLLITGWLFELAGGATYLKATKEAVVKLND